MGNWNNKISALGTGYVNDFFQGALILDKPGNRVLRIGSFSDGNVLQCAALDLATDIIQARWGRSIYLSLQEAGVETFSAFSWPKMGYRNAPCPHLGNTVWFFTTARGTGRGLRIENVNIEQLGIFDVMLNSIPDSWSANGFAANTAAKALAIYNPKWYSFKEGMTRLREGDWLGFALNEDLAVTVAHQTSQLNGYDVYFRGSIAGSISAEGHLVMKNKTLSRTALQKFMDEEASL